MPLDLMNMTIDKVVIHTVPKRTPERLPGTPTYAAVVIKLPPSVAASFQTRITEALGKSSHGIEVAIVEDDEKSFLQVAARLMHAPDKEFLVLSQKLPDALAKCQVNRDLAASKLIVVSGKAGAGRKRFLVVIKAELQDGFSESAKTGIEHLQNLFLTPSQKLFKIGFLLEDVPAPADESGLYDRENYSAFLFDHLMNEVETRKAAHYFYSHFLGTEIIATDKKLTRDFFELTKEFINSAPLSQDTKVDFLDALRVELKSNAAVVHVESFAKHHFDAETTAKYIAFMNSREFPRTAVSKDTAFIATRLRRRQRIKFQHGVEITAPPDKLHQLVKIEKTSADQTVIIVKGPIEQQE